MSGCPRVGSKQTLFSVGAFESRHVDALELEAVGSKKADCMATKTVVGVGKPAWPVQDVAVASANEFVGPIDLRSRRPSERDVVKAGFVHLELV